MNDTSYHPIQPVSYTPVDHLQSQSSPWQNKQNVMAASILGSAVVGVFGILLLNWMPGDKAKLDQLESRLREAQSQSIQQTQLIKQYEKMLAQQTHVVAGLKEDNRELNETIAQIKQLVVNGESQNDSDSDPTRNSN